MFRFLVLLVLVHVVCQATNHAAAAKEQKQHFVLVHGACHGAWNWYKIIPLLESKGHNVTAFDLAASGINMKSIEDIHTFAEYSRPLLELMASLPPQEKVILVGHSLGGLNLALAMEKFPEKISVAVFLTAFLPDTVHRPSYVLEEQKNTMRPEDGWLDTKFASYGSPKKPSTSMLFGPKDLCSKFYQFSPIEDLELAKTLVRTGSLFVEDLSKAKKFTESRYGSVERVFIVCDEDKAIRQNFQRWMIQNSGTKNVMVIRGADHMAMLSKPQEVFHSFLKIANRYA